METKFCKGLELKPDTDRNHFGTETGTVALYKLAARPLCSIAICWAWNSSLFPLPSSLFNVHWPPLQALPAVQLRSSPTVWGLSLSVTATNGNKRMASSSSSSSSIALKDMVPAAENNINTRFILLEKRNNTSRNIESQGKQERTSLALVADETAAVHFQLWGEECDAFEAGDIIRLTNGIFSYDRSKQAVLRAGKRGKAEKVGEFTLAFVETPNMSEIRWGPNPNNPKRLVQEAVISPYSRIFPPQH